MLLRFSLSGSVIFEGPSDCVPTVGSEVVFVTQNYKKGIHPGTLVSATVTDDSPPIYDFAESDGVIVTLDVDRIQTHTP